MVAIAAMILSFNIFMGCHEHTGMGPKSSSAGKLISVSDCKDWSYIGAGGKLSRWDCVDYQYEGDSLLLCHFNAGFNCCPTIKAEFKVSGDTILIDEVETEGDCHCLCLYDLFYCVSDLPPGSYLIKIIEPYLQPGDSLLEFITDLTAPMDWQASFCATRNHYPWGSDGIPDGYLESYTGCNENDYENDYDSTNCMEFDFDGVSVLTLRHRNVYFNCCLDSLTANVQINGDTIEMTEGEYVSAPCDCVCLYSLNFYLDDIRPGEYIIIARKRDSSPYTPTLSFDIDMSKDTNGIYCSRIF
jgi:hypothetical protein